MKNLVIVYQGQNWASVKIGGLTISDNISGIYEVINVIPFSRVSFTVDTTLSQEDKDPRALASLASMVCALNQENTRRSRNGGTLQSIRIGATDYNGQDSTYN